MMFGFSAMGRVCSLSGWLEGLIMIVFDRAHNHHDL